MSTNFSTLLYLYSYFSHIFCVHLNMSIILFPIYIVLLLLPYGAKGTNMPCELRYNNCAIIITPISGTFSIGFQ